MTTSAKIARIAAAIVVTIGAMLALTRVTAMPLSYRRSSPALLRVSWSARPERIEVCRTLSAEELAQRPEHMRQREECDGRFATYALRVEVDGRLAGDGVAHGAGLRRDRPLYLLREFDLPPGRHEVKVTFARREHTDNDAAAFAPVATTGTDTGLFAGRATREAAEHARRAEAAIPALLSLDTSIVIASRSVTLVTLNTEQRALQLVGGTAGRAPR